MDEFARTEILVPHRARIRLPGRRGVVEAVGFAHETFDIRRLHPGDAPVAMQANFGNAREENLRWLDFEGSYWRPVVTSRPKPVQTHNQRLLQRFRRRVGVVA